MATKKIKKLEFKHGNDTLVLDLSYNLDTLPYGGHYAVEQKTSERWYGKDVYKVIVHYENIAAGARTLPTVHVGASPLKIGDYCAISDVVAVEKNTSNQGSLNYVHGLGSTRLSLTLLRYTASANWGICCDAAVDFSKITLVLKYTKP